jgi:putative cell wall-binding protein
MKKILALLVLFIAFLIAVPIVSAEPVTTEVLTTTTTVVTTATTIAEEDTLIFETWAENFFGEMNLDSALRLISMVMTLVLAFVALSSKVKERIKDIALKRLEEQAEKKDVTLQCALAAMEQISDTLNLIVQGSKLDSGVKTTVAENTVRLKNVLSKALDYVDVAKEAANTVTDVVGDIKDFLELATRTASVLKGAPGVPIDKTGV